MLLLCVLLAIVLLLRGCPKDPALVEHAGNIHDTLTVPDAFPVPIGPETVTVLSDSAVPVDTTKKKMITNKPKRDTIANIAVIDTVDTQPSMIPDSALKKESGQCAGDTAALWVYPDPSGGIHYSPVNIVFVTNRPAIIQYRRGDDSVWQQYTGQPILLDTTTTLYYDAIDSCGVVMERRSEYYEVERQRTSSGCPNGMELVKLGTMNFCIDRYEWPNRNGGKPAAFVSYYQATDSCFSVGKRLCTAEEWAIACSGPYAGRYPYGQLYERYGCVTHDTMVAASGSKPECRSFYGLYDMSGNLLEWTSTKSVENSAFYYVAGGFWESGPKSGCFDKRYSYYPQNQHNPVGFRCCQDRSQSETSPETNGK